MTTNVSEHPISVLEKPDSFRRKAEQVRRTSLRDYWRSKTVSGARTLLADEVGFRMTMTDATDVVWTMPNSLNEGYVCWVVQSGAGRATFTPEAGATVNSMAATDRTLGQYALVRIDVLDNSDGASANYLISGDVG